MKVMEVRCPVCKSPAGVKCKTASGVTMHWQRLAKALRQPNLTVIEGGKSEKEAS